MLIDEAEAAASFFPTTNEVVRAVQFVRDNPAVVLGVVVGITSLSVARYYEDGDEVEDESPVVVSEDHNDAIDTPSSPMPEPAQISPPRKMTRSTRSSTLLLSGDVSSIAETTSSGTIGSSERLAAHSDQHDEDKDVDAICDKMQKNCSFCNQAKESPEACCDPDWGWFIPTSPDDELRHHHHHHQNCEDGKEHHGQGVSGA